jgi:hypothetical protein
MLDVLHAMFEEDYTPTWEQDIEVKGKLRAAIYDSLYNEEYGWIIEQNQSAGSSMQVGEYDDDAPAAKLRPAPRFQRLPAEGLAASAVNPETGTIDLPEGTKRADPAKRLPRVQSATPMEDLGTVLGQPLG